MLTSSTNASNQYLRPEYLTPLPTTLDAKKSPLALLAQTCSQIGADSPNPKALLPPLEKKKESSSSRDKISPSTNDSSSNSTPSTKSVGASFKPYENNKEAASGEASGRSSSGRSKTPQSSKSTTPNNNNTIHVTNAPTTRSPTMSPSSRKTPSEARGHERTSPVSSKAAAFSSLITGGGESRATPPTPNTSAAAAAALASLPPGFLGGYPHLPSDLALSSLMFGKSHAHPLSPYLSYSRMKTPGGGESLVPVCRDPYCTGCTLSSHLLKAAAATPTTSGSSASTVSSPSAVATPTCPSGCVTCDHQKGAGSPSSHQLGAAAALALPHLLSSPYASSLSAAHHLPYVCNWIAGDTYCGKRFPSSDELLQHLRSHTNLSESLAAAAAGLPTHPLLASHAAAMAALHRSTYPTPPLSPLAAAARYHPYSKPPLPPSLSSFPLHPHPGMPPYFSPYSLYGRAASGMHP